MTMTWGFQGRILGQPLSIRRDAIGGAWFKNAGFRVILGTCGQDPDRSRVEARVFVESSLVLEHETANRVLAPKLISQ